MRSFISNSEMASPKNDIPFVNAMRLTPRQWLATLALCALIGMGTPMLWKHLETFQTPADYRIPYSLSKDYWLYHRRLERLDSKDIVLLGDSVVWGEYVQANGTLSHFLNANTNGTTPTSSFVNAGVNGLFPLALEGLVTHYGQPLKGHKVILHCNVLWMTSPKADLQTPKEERFNHADLVPQFRPRIPCYKADWNQRIGVSIERIVPFFQWSTHLQIVYFGQKNLVNWSLEEDPADSKHLPNAYANPFSKITLVVPPEPEVDPERGPQSPRHKPWSTTGQGSTRFEWVDFQTSLQWQAFQRLVFLLKSRGNDVFVVVGPFNEHIMADENKAAFRTITSGILKWLKEQSVAFIAPETLPSSLYADASHPLTEGYRILADRLRGDSVFSQWIQKK